MSNLHSRCMILYQRMRASRKVTKIGTSGIEKIEDVMTCNLNGNAVMTRVPHFSGIPYFDIKFNDHPDQLLRVRLRSLKRNGVELRGDAKKAEIKRIGELLTLNGA